jgi:hypothetical protein
MELHKTSKKETPKQNLTYMRDKDREPVKGIFRFHEVPGGEMSFSIRIYKGDPVENYTFKDGEIKTIPLGVAKHLNKNCWYPEYDYVKTEDMQNVAKITKKIKRCSFQSLEFMDIEDLGNETVKSVEASI